MFNGTNFISAILLTSRNIDRLATFYKDVLKVPLEDEQHGESAKHYGCDLGDFHFAIHPIESFGGEDPGVGSTKIAFEIFDMPGFVKHVESLGVELLYQPKEMGPMLITALKDPDGNHVEFTQLGEGWIKHLEKRRDDGHCLIKTWKKHQ
jgi:catechol 2,3-dioxygenase-like lactoylglutathione lyase family enzyme